MKFIQQLFQKFKGSVANENTIILDTSALNSDESMKIIEEASKVILLTGIIREMDDNKGKYGKLGINIRTVSKLSRQDEKSEKYICVSGYDKYDYEDDNIIDYCKKHKGVTILTSDNNLCNTAKAYSIPYKYIEYESSDITSEDQIKQQTQKTETKNIKKENSLKNNSKNEQGKVYLYKNFVKLIPTKNFISDVIVVRDKHIICRENYRKGDYIYALKYNKSQKYLDIDVYEIINDNGQLIPKEIEEYRAWYVNEIYTYKFPSQLEEKFCSFYLSNTNY